MAKRGLTFKFAPSITRRPLRQSDTSRSYFLKGVLADIACPSELLLQWQRPPTDPVPGPMGASSPLRGELSCLGVSAWFLVLCQSFPTPASAPLASCALPSRSRN